MSEEAIGAEFSPFWWWLADKALLSSTQESHEWLCKQPKREGTFPLAESAVKRFPVTVIAAFGGIISVVTVGRGGKGSGWQGKSQRRLVYQAESTQGEPGVKHRVTVWELGWWLCEHSRPFTSLQMDRAPSSGVPTGGCTLTLSPRL